MKFKLNTGRDVFVRWKYDDEGVTVCKIELSSDVDNILLLGTAKLAECDHFNKDTGRKVSMSRALKKYPFTKEERSQFWEAYRKMTITPRW
jgi:hypothetical protein